MSSICFVDNIYVIYTTPCVIGLSILLTTQCIRPLPCTAVFARSRHEAVDGIPYVTRVCHRCAVKRHLDVAVSGNRRACTV